MRHFGGFENEKINLLLCSDSTQKDNCKIKINQVETEMIDLKTKLLMMNTTLLNFEVYYELILSFPKIIL